MPIPIFARTMKKLELLMTVVAFTAFLPRRFATPIGPSSNETISRMDVGAEDLTANTSTLPVVQDEDNKHELYKECLKFALDPDEFVIFENGTAYVEVYNKTYNSSFYQLADGKLKVCIPEIEDTEYDDGNDYLKFPLALTYVTVAGLVISILCLFLHLVVFCLLPDMRNLPSYNTASLCLSLLLGYVCFITSHAGMIQESTVPCTFFAAATQFFMMAAFLWMSTMAFDVFRSLLKATGKLRLATARFNVKRYACYCLYSWGTPIVFVAVTLLLDNVEGVPEDFLPMIGQDICWFNQRKPLLFLFAVPLFLVALMNVLFFAMSAYIIYTNRMSTEEMEYRNMLKRNLIMYFRLSVLMGLTWVVGIVVGIVNAMWLWYVFALLNTLQGFFIFVAFTCTEKVKNRLKEKFVARSRKISCQSSTPTFQSYCNTGFTSDYDTKTFYGQNLDDSPLTMKKISDCILSETAIVPSKKISQNESNVLT